MRRIEDLIGMPIVAVDQGARIGRLDGVQIDGTQGRIAYLHFKGEDRRADGIIPWESVRAVGADAITIESEDTLRQAVPAADRDGLLTHVGDRPVVTESGSRIGKITSYEVDPQTGYILSYRIHCGGGMLSWLTGRDIELPHAAVRTFGRDAIIVADDVIPEQRQAA